MTGSLPTTARFAGLFLSVDPSRPPVQRLVSRNSRCMQVAHWPPNPIDSGSGNFSAADQTELGSLTGISEQYPQSATLRFAASKTFVVVPPIAQFHRAVSSI